MSLETFSSYQHYVMHRIPFFQTLDNWGEVPIVGSVSAIARIFLGNMLLLHACVKSVSSGSWNMKITNASKQPAFVPAKDWYWVQGKCALHEVARGVVELFPTLINIIQWKANRDKANYVLEASVHSIFATDWLARKNCICVDPAGEIHYFDLEKVKDQNWPQVTWRQEKDTRTLENIKNQGQQLNKENGRCDGYIPTEVPQRDLFKTSQYVVRNVELVKAEYLG